MKKDSWLYSDSFLKRAFAIWGHYFVANLIIGFAVFLIGLMLALVFGSVFAGIANVFSEGRGPVMERHMMDQDF